MLGVESSYDDSALALVTLDGQVINQKSKNMLREASIKGGITPTEGARHHYHSLPLLYQQLFQQGCGLIEGQIQAIAVTVGPGQEHSLNQGIRFAQKLGRRLKIPVYPVNHLEAHCLIPRMKTQGMSPKFPFISCLATGTSTDLVLHKDLGCNLIYGIALDQAVGAALDGASRKLFSHPVFKDPKAMKQFTSLQRGKMSSSDLWFLNDENIHGGKRLEELAKLGSIFQAAHIPNTQSISLDLSFSGIQSFTYKEIYQTKESVPRHKLTYSNVSIQHLANLAATIQFKAFAQIQRKLWKLLDWYSAENSLNNLVKQVVLAGGVARNQALRNYLQDTCQAHGKVLITPDPELCSDNAVMIAWAGWELLARDKKANIMNQKVRGIHRMPVGPLVRIPVLRKGYLNAEELKRKRKPI